MKNKILIFGGTGLLGYNLIKFLNKNYKLYLNFHKTKIENNNIIYKKIIVKKKINSSIIDNIKPDIIINCIANTNLDYCEKSYTTTKYQNSSLAIMLSKICKKKNIKFVHISTDHLYSKLIPFKNEKIKCNPINVYARQKLMAEKGILFNNKNALVLRTNFFGHYKNNNKSIKNLILNLKNHKKISMDKNYFFTPIYTLFLIKALLILIKKNKKGIFNIVGNDRISKYEFLKLIAKQFKIKNYKIENVPLEKNFRLLAKRCKDLSLSNNKLKKETRIIIPGIKKQIMLFKEFENKNFSF